METECPRSTWGISKLSSLTELHQTHLTIPWGFEHQMMNTLHLHTSGIQWVLAKSPLLLESLCGIWHPYTCPLVSGLSVLIYPSATLLNST